MAFSLLENQLEPIRIYELETFDGSEYKNLSLEYNALDFVFFGNDIDALEAQEQYRFLFEDVSTTTNAVTISVDNEVTDYPVVDTDGLTALTGIELEGTRDYFVFDGDKFIRVLQEAKFVFIDIISNYESLFFTRDWEGIGSWNLVINLNKPKALQLIQGRYIQVGNDNRRQGIISYREFKLQTDTGGNFVNVLLVKGLEISSLLLPAVTIPDGGVLNDNGEIDYVGGEINDSYLDVPEVIMKSLVDKSRIGNTLFPFTNIPNLFNQPLQGFGNSIFDEISLTYNPSLRYYFFEGVDDPVVGQRYQFTFPKDATTTQDAALISIVGEGDLNDFFPAREEDGSWIAGTQLEGRIIFFDFDGVAYIRSSATETPIFFSTRFKVLSDELKVLSQQSGLGWNVEMDLANNEFIFNVTEGVDRSESQSENDRAIFSLRRGNLRQLTYIEDDITSRNHMFVAGQGEGSDRSMVFVGDSTLTGVNSKMKFVDARDVETSDGLFDRGFQKLSESARRVTVDLRGFSKKGTSKLDVDYTLGDIVTVEVPEWDLQLDVRIIRVVERITPNNAGTIELIFGTDRETLEGIIKSSMADVRNETNR